MIKQINKGVRFYNSSLQNHSKMCTHFLPPGGRAISLPVDCFRPIYVYNRKVCGSINSNLMAEKQTNSILLQLLSLMTPARMVIMKETGENDGTIKSPSVFSHVCAMYPLKPSNEMCGSPLWCSSPKPKPLRKIPDQSKLPSSEK